MSKRLAVLLVFFFCSYIFATDFIGQPAPEFKGKDIHGKKIQLSDYRGKIVLLDFWATWCAPCQKEFPFLVEFYKRHKNEDFIILAINIDNVEDNMLRFLSKNYATHVFPVIFDSEKTIPPLYDLETMPTSVFIDKKGIVRYIHTGFKDSSKKQFSDELTTLLHEK